MSTTELSAPEQALAAFRVLEWPSDERLAETMWAAPNDTIHRWVIKAPKAYKGWDLMPPNMLMGVCSGKFPLGVEELYYFPTNMEALAFLIWKRSGKHASWADGFAWAAPEVVVPPTPTSVSTEHKGETHWIEAGKACKHYRLGSTWPSGFIQMACYTREGSYEAGYMVEYNFNTRKRTVKRLFSLGVDGGISFKNALPLL